MITGHRYRPPGNYASTASTGERGGIGPRQCAWNGTCKRSEAEHEWKGRPVRPRKRSTAPYVIKENDRG